MERIEDCIGLRFLLAGGGFLDVITTKADAFAFGELWSKRDQTGRPLTQFKVFSRTDPVTLQAWAVLLEQVIAYHTMAIRVEPEDKGTATKGDSRKPFGL